MSQSGFERFSNVATWGLFASWRLFDSCTCNGRIQPCLGHFRLAFNEQIAVLGHFRAESKAGDHEKE